MLDWRALRPVVGLGVPPSGLSASLAQHGVPTCQP